MREGYLLGSSHSTKLGTPSSPSSSSAHSSVRSLYTMMSGCTCQKKSACVSCPAGIRTVRRLQCSKRLDATWHDKHLIASTLVHTQQTTQQLATASSFSSCCAPEQGRPRAGARTSCQHVDLLTSKPVRLSGSKNNLRTRVPGALRDAAQTRGGPAALHAPARCISVPGVAHSQAANKQLCIMTEVITVLV